MKKIPTILLLLVPYVFIAAFLNFGLTKYVFLLWPILWVVICLPNMVYAFFSSPAGNHSKATVVLEYGAETVQHSRVCGSVSGSSAAQYYGDSPASVFDAVRLFPAVALYHVWYQRDLAELSEREVFAGGNSRQYHPAFFLLRRCVQLDLLLCARKESFTINPDLCVHMKYACNRIFRFFYKFAMT